MWDQSTNEQLQKRFSQAFRENNDALTKLSVLYHNLPVPEAEKKQFIDCTLKQRSAWYACLVNPNIDVLLLPEYLDSKLSRNILIKRETEQYFRSIDNFGLHSSDNIQTLYNSILYVEETEPKSSFDLFSAQTPEPLKCPQGLMNLFKTWDKKFEAYSAFERIVYSFLDWHRYNGFSFSGQRQMVLWVHFQLWKLYGPVVFKLQLENFFFHHLNREIKDPNIVIHHMMEFIGDELTQSSLELKGIYRAEVAYDGLKSMQRIVSNHVFETGFSVNGLTEMPDGLIKKLLMKKGSLQINDFEDSLELEKQKEVIDQLLMKDIIVSIREDGGIYYCLNTSMGNHSSDLIKYKNTNSELSSISLDEFINQPRQKPIIPIEKLNIPEPSVIQVKAKRQKAFFG